MGLGAFISASLVQDENLDPDVLMWELRRALLAKREPIDARRVIEIQLSGVPAAKRFYWLVFEADEIDLCIRNPGYEVSLWVAASLRTLVEIWLGHRSLADAEASEALRLDGDKPATAAFRDFLSKGSHFAEVGRELAAPRGLAET